METDTGANTTKDKYAELKYSVFETPQDFAAYRDEKVTSEFALL